MSKFEMVVKLEAMLQSSSLGSLVDIRGGGTPSKAVPEYWGGGIPWASVKVVQINWKFQQRLILLLWKP